MSTPTFLVGRSISSIHNIYTIQNNTLNVDAYLSGRQVHIKYTQYIHYTKQHT